MKFSAVILIFAIFERVCAQDDAPRVKTLLGGIKGFYRTSQKGRKFEAYEGIPYAIPPVGHLRFELPQKMPAWEGEIAVTSKGHECLQYQIVPSDTEAQVVGSEDCLYLNVYVPTESGDQPLPVIFYIHGGAFQFGSGTTSGPKYLMDKNIILVTINYRLSVFGFLSTENEVVPGNMGLKDQNLALRWVSENIEWFGGDPEKITLAGLSAGGVSVHYHYFSPASANLFQGGISFSGSALGCWAQTENSLEKAKKLAAIMGCPTIDTKEMVRCLRYRPGRAMAFAVKQFMPWLFNPFTPFGPVVEKHGDQPFISKSPIDMINNGELYDVPWVTGVTSEEGLCPVAEFAANGKLLKELNDNWEELTPFLLDYNYTLPREKHSETARLIRTHYLGTKGIDKSTVKQLTHMVGDRMFVIDSEKAARMQAKANKNPVWFYFYSYRGNKSLSDYFSGTTEDFGTSHGDDVLLVMENKVTDPITAPQDLAMQKDLMDMWFSFATDKVPKIGNVEWEKLDPTKEAFSYLHISGPGKLNMEENLNLGEKQFWSTISFEENMMSPTNQNAEDDLQHF